MNRQKLLLFAQTTTLGLALTLPGPVQAVQDEKLRSNPAESAAGTKDQHGTLEVGLNADELGSLSKTLHLSGAEIGRLPKSKLQPLLRQLRHPGVDLHSEALKFRRLHLQDEHGKIPANAWVNAAEERKQMSFNPAAWPGNHTQDLSAPKPQLPGQTGPGGSPKPLVAGIESSGWTWLGPGNIGGRVRSILIDPTTPSTMWAGGVDGGVWKTLNAGTSWFALDDFMANLAICCMAMDPANPNVIYVGTGEGFGNGDAVQGDGIFMTTDGGTTWTQLSSTAAADFYFVNRLAINPTNSQIILAATGNGIFRTTDGGSTWSQRYNPGTDDLAFDPSNGSRCVASGYGFVLYSTDAGVTWSVATGITGAGRVEIAYAPSQPITVYASADKNYGELYLSVDGGHTYSLKNTGTEYFGGPSEEQGWYDNCIWVDPTNPNLLIVGGLDLWRSTDGGTTLTDIGGYTGGLHSDQHVIVQIPSFNGTTVRTVYFGNDGGVFSATDVYTVSPSSGWNNLNNNLGITQFYGAAGNATSGTIIAGAQDNGVERYKPSSGPEGWTYMAGGDGGACAADPTDTNYFYSEYVYLELERSTDGGSSSSFIFSGIGDAGSQSSANFIAPFVLDPNNPNTMLAGGSNLWRSLNVKATTPTWSNIKAGIASRWFISAIAVAPGNSSLIWVGYGDGSVYATANGTAASPTWTQENFGTPNLPQRYCACITIDPNNEDRVYVTFGGFNQGNLWRTTDAGSTWSDVSGNLPQAPANSLVIDPHDSSYLYVGTEVGVFASDNGGATWSPSNDGPANVNVDQLIWVGDTLVAATHGRGCFSIQPVIWVDFNTGLNPPLGVGTYSDPFLTLAEGVNAASPGGEVWIRTAGSSGESVPLTISKRLTIKAYNGAGTVGH